MLSEFLTGLAIASVMASPISIPQQRDAEKDYVALGYCIDDIQVQIGFGSQEELGAAIFVPKEMLSAYEGGEIVGLRIGIANEASNVKTFLIKGNDINASPTLSTTAGDRSIGMHDIMFRVPYQIDDDIIVGYYSTGFNQIGMDGNTPYENASYVNRKGTWGSIYKSAVNNGFGALCIQLLIKGGMPDAEMSLEKVMTKHAEQGKPFNLRVQARNNTTNPVNDFDVNVRLSDGTSSSHHVVCPIAPASVAEFEVPMQGVAKTGPMPVQVQITAVNGTADADDTNNTVTGTFNVIEEGCYFPRIVVAEEATSILCGFCPKGIVVLESMRQRHPDSFIGIAVHLNDMGQDDMAHDSYSDFLWYCENTGLPNSMVNRKYEGDPLLIDTYYDRECGQLAVAGIEFSKPLKAINGKVEISTTTTFAADHSNANYRLAYVLLEDNIEGYTQKNDYSSGYYGSMAGWENLPSFVDMNFNDVARGIKDLDGMPGSVPSDIVKKQRYQWSATMDIPADARPQNMSAVALLLDRNNNDEIVQAAKLKFGAAVGDVESVASSSEEVSFSIENGSVIVPDSQSVELFSANGIRVANHSLTPGIYLVRAVVGNSISNFKVFVK